MIPNLNRAYLAKAMGYRLYEERLKLTCWRCTAQSFQLYLRKKSLALFIREPLSLIRFME
jgi:hypothetical protein